MGARRVDGCVETVVDASLYITKNQYNVGGLALYGRLLEVRRLTGRYWPSGRWGYPLPIRVEGVAEGGDGTPRGGVCWTGGGWRSWA